MHTILRPLAISAVILAGTVALTRAQTAPELPSRPIAGWSFTPAVAVGLVHDTNATLRATSGFSQGLPDQLWTVEPSGDLGYLGKYTTFDASYHGELRRYATLNALDQYTQRGAVSVSHRATPHLTFHARDSYARVPTTDQLDIEGIVPFSRIGSRVNTLTGGMDAKLSQFTTMTATYTGSWVRFDEPDNLVLRGANVHSLGATASRRVSQRLSVGGAYQYRIADLDAGRHQFRFQDVGATLGYQAGPNTMLDGEAGVAHVTDRVGLTSKVGPYFKVGANQRTEHALLGVSYQHLFVPSLGFAGANTSQQLRGFVHVPLGRRLYTDDSLSWRSSNPLLANTLKIKSIWLTSGVGYEYARWLTLRGFYRFTRQDSEVFGGVIGRHRIGFEAVFSQPVRIQ